MVVLGLSSNTSCSFDQLLPNLLQIGPEIWELGKGQGPDSAPLKFQNVIVCETHTSSLISMWIETWDRIGGYLDLGQGLGLGVRLSISSPADC